PSFVVTAKAYTDFIKGFEGRLDYYLDKIDINDKQQLREIATKIQTLILSSDFPQMLEREILDAYESMNVDVGFSRQLRAFDFLKTGDKGVVAVRTSAVAKEPHAIKDREFISFLNIQGVVQLLRAIKACWASLFSTDNITHRVQNGYGHKDVYAAVVVQKMVKSEKSGILLTSNPNGNRNEAIIEICWGLGKTLPEVMPDSYTLDKKQNRILDESVHRQTWAYFGGVQGRIEKQDLPDKKLRSSKLESAEMIRLSNIAKDVEDKYDEPYEIEFTFDKERMWIIGMKPMHGDNLKPVQVETERIAKEKSEIDAEEETKEVDDIISNIFKAPPIKRPVKREETKILQPVVLNKPGTHPTIKVTQEVEEKEETVEKEPIIEEKEEFEEIRKEIIKPEEKEEEEKEEIAPELEIYDVPEKKAEPERLSYEEQQKLIEEIKQKYAPAIVEAEEEPEIE
ncbi:PEP/pyruvate-binding domain-containing protein, partial [Candidatus Woesearchaeota archaeon]|nr:PEP/pyruvate-binding domain-containing protein [Candidatus Woesearchaeota archaeon]